MMRWTLLLTAVLIAATQPARADRGPERCYLVAEGGEAAFLAFDTELRSALSSADASTLALLVDFPLRVNFGDGTTISLNNPMAVQQRFQEVFPDALRAAVIKRKPEDLFCRDDGIMYGSGELWIHLVGQGEARHFAVATVNVPAGDRKVTAPATPVLFVCNADKHRIIVDMSSDGGVRYRSWNKPRSLADKADIVVAGGSADIEGTSVCAHSLWTFKKGKTTFLVSEPGCGEMPEGASGEIEVLVDEERRMQSWCY